MIAGLGRELLEPLVDAIWQLGYRSFWINDAARPEADGLAGLAIIAEAAPPALGLGVGVLPLDRRSPDAIADAVRRLDLPLERLRLGVGSGSADRPLGVVRDGVAQLRELLPGARIFVAALGPMMSTLAGEVADGVLFNWAVPRRLVQANGWVDDGERSAGRPHAERWSYIRATTGDRARERLGAEARRYARSPAYGRAFESMHARYSDVGIAGDDLAAQLAPYRSILDGAVIRALPAEWDLRHAVEIARIAGAPASSGSGATAAL